MAKHFPAPWVDGVSSDVIVVKQKPEGFTNSMMIKAYGGYLVAETIASCNKPLIKRAPSMLTLLEKALPIIEEEAERRERASWTDTEGDDWLVRIGGRWNVYQQRRRQVSSQLVISTINLSEAITAFVQAAGIRKEDRQHD